MNIPFVDLKAQYLAIGGEVREALYSVLKDTAFIGGRYLKLFEKDFAAYTGARFAVGVSSGTDALRLALIACGVGPGDEVITVPNTFIGTSEAISMIGAKVRFVDVESDSYNMDPSLLEAAITPRTRAIIPVHLFGRPADMGLILEFAKAHGLKVIGDAAQAHGAMYRGKKIGTLGNAACFSFFPSKNLGAYGDAGAVVTDDPEIAEKISMLRNHGRKKKYEHDMEGFNCRMDAIQAAILSVKLKYLEDWTEKRIKNAAIYDRLLAEIPSVITPKRDENVRAVYHLYVVRVDERSELQKHLNEKGVSTGIHYPISLHRQPAYAYLEMAEGCFPVAEKHACQILSLPLYPEMTEGQIEFVARQIQASMS